MTARPLVAVPAYRLEPGRVARWSSGAHAIPEPYVAALLRAGLYPVVVPATAPGGDVGGLLAPFTGLVLIGGGDVAPERYGGQPHPAVYGVDPGRDELEIVLAREARRRGTPVLGICRGAQVLNVAFGGTLFPHLPEIPRLGPHGVPGEGDPVVHDVRIEPGSRLAAACRTATVRSSSHHHQGLDRLGSGLVPVARAADGLVEAVEGEDGWMLGVQWHPEDTAGQDPAQQAIFDAFGEQAERA